MGLKFTGIKNGKGCGCCGGGGCAVTVNMDSCAACPVDFTLTVKSGGSTIWSGSMGAGMSGHDGTVVVDVGSAGTYDFVLDGAGFSSVSESHAVNCGDTVNLAPSPNVGLACTIVDPTRGTYSGTLFPLGTAWQGNIGPCAPPFQPCWRIDYCGGAFGILDVSDSTTPPTCTLTGFSVSCSPLDVTATFTGTGGFGFCPSNGSTIEITE